MKKSSIILKILLAMVILSLVFALVACGGDEDEPEPTPTPDKPAEETLSQKLVTIVSSLKPLISEVAGIKADSKVGVSLELGVEYKNADGSGNYKLGAHGNIAATDPELAIHYTAGSTEWFNLALINKTVYLRQPLTAVNTSNDVDSVKANVSALKPAVDDIAWIAMDALAKLAATDTISKLPGMIDDLGDTIDGLLTGLGLDLEALIDVKKDDKGYTLGMSGTNFGAIRTFLRGIKIVGDTSIDDILSSLFGGKGNPGLEIKINIKDGAASGLSVGYNFNKDDYGAIVIDTLELSTSSKVDLHVKTDGYSESALNANLGLNLPGKGVKAALSAYVNPDLSAKDTYLAYASLDINSIVAEGYVKGGAVFFDTAAMYEALNSGANNALVSGSGNKYTASLKDGTKDDDLADRKNITFVDFVNNAASNAKKNYQNPPKKEESTDKNDKKEDNISKSIFVSIYELLGGDLGKLGTETKDGKASYKDPSEKQMLEALNDLIGAHTTFKVDEDSYIKVINNILGLVEENDQWIVGFDFVKSKRNLNAIGDIVTLDNWFEVDKDALKACKDAGEFGIFNWDTSAYSGGALLSKADEKNDLLDAVNVFACDAEGHAFTVESIAAECNYYIAALGYFMGDDLVFSANQKSAIKDIDDTLIPLKKAWDDAKKGDNQKAIDDAKKAYNDKKAENKEQLKAYYTAENAQKVLTNLFGITDSLVTIANNGLMLNVGSKKDAGLYGFIALADDDGEVYASIDGSIGFAKNEVAKKAGDIAFAAGDAVNDLWEEASQDSIFDELALWRDSYYRWQKAAA